MYDSDCNKVMLQFTRNAVFVCNVSKALVTIDTYKSLDVDIHKDLVTPRGAFTMRIYAGRKNHDGN